MSAFMGLECKSIRAPAVRTAAVPLSTLGCCTGLIHLRLSLLLSVEKY